MTETKLSTAGDAPTDSSESNGGGEVAANDQQADVNEQETLSTNDIHSLLKNQRRRYVLTYLRANEGSARLRDVAEQIAAWENDKELKAITSSERKRAYVGLYQCHLPKMDDADVVSFDQNRGDIEVGPNAEQLMPYLDDDANEEEETVARSWADRYLAVAGVALLVTVVAAGVGAGAVGLAIAAATSLSVGALSLAERRSADE